MKIEWTGKTYDVDPVEAYACERILLPDGTLLRVRGWRESHPPTPVDFEALPVALASPEASAGTVLWSGKLATGGRAPEPFDAEIVDSPEGPVILRRNGLSRHPVSPEEIRGDSWLPLLASALRRAGKP